MRRDERCASGWGRGEDGDRGFGEERLGVQAAQVVGRRVQEGRVGLAFAEHGCGVGAESDLDGDGVRLAFVGGEDRGEQTRVAAGLHGQDQARLVRPGALRAQCRGGHRVQRDTCFAGEDAPGIGERDRAARPLEQRDAQPALQPPDRLGQCGLRDAHPRRGTPEMQLLGHRQEVGQLPGLQPIHTRRLSIVARTVLDAPQAAVVG
ncbi:hypothetical protein FHU30_004325 [Actinomadura rupiterrae]|nr:hypothetical protein [Actinomadura rupiterrae]